MSASEPFLQAPCLGDRGQGESSFSGAYEINVLGGLVFPEETGRSHRRRVAKHP